MSQNARTPLTEPATSEAPPRPITEVAARLGLPPKRLYPYGTLIAKVQGAPPPPRGQLVLVTALTPTPAGEGKTTVSIGLVEALARRGVRVAAALREPSLGPVFGIKGGATGGGRASLVPAADINLHFTGDFHAVSAANNLLCALVDNHLHQGNALELDPRRTEVRRVLDINDRALRQVVVGLGGVSNGVPRESGFDITVASEVMAVMALAQDADDLQTRLGRIRVGLSSRKKVVYAADLGAQGAMTALLLRALEPNLVQTLEGQAAFVHMGPFANIAHGASSLVSAQMALGYADVVVTEAGFGSDLGAEKFLNVVSRQADVAPAAVVLVVTVRALRYHGGAKDVGVPDLEALRTGLANLEAHVAHLRLYGYTPVVALNRFAGDTEAETEAVLGCANALGLEAAECDVFARGGEGGLALADAVMRALATPQPLTPLYDLELPLRDKVARVVTRVYGGAGVSYSPQGERAMRRAERDAPELPVVIAKTPASLSDNASLRNRPEGFTVHVTDVAVRRGAGFVVVYMGHVMTMPGLPQTPAALAIGVAGQEITGIV